MVMHFSGRIADSFDREFRCMYADSQIIDCFHNPEEDGMPYYPPYQSMLAPGMGMGLGPVMGLDLLSDRYEPGVQTSFRSWKLLYNRKIYKVLMRPAVMFGLEGVALTNLPILN